MKYYSEETVKQMLKDTKVISITRNMYGNIVQDFRIVRPKIEDYPSIEDDNPWHTGVPQEEGWYLCSTKASAFSVHHYDGNNWDLCTIDFVIAWQKIEPYKEKA